MATELDVLQVITSTTARGAERFALALEPELVDRGLSVRTVALTRGKPHGLDVEYLGPKRLGPSTLRALRKEAKRASVVVAHGSTTLPACAVATFGLKADFIYRNIGDPYYWATSDRKRLQSRILLSRADNVVALTSDTADRIIEFYRVDPDRISVIPRGVSAEEFPARNDEDRYRVRRAMGVADDVRLAICVGALSEEKNVTNAVNAMAMLPPRWQLFVAGDGPDRGPVTAAAAAVPDGRVRMLGSVTNVPGLMTAADLLLLPSRTEGLPGVVIEAAMIGVPSVSTNVGFIEEIIEDGVSGLLVPSNDSAAMAEAVLAAEPDLAQLGRVAQKQAVASFSLEATAERWYHLLRRYVPDASLSGR